ncbi:MAG: TolC family protein [Gammaproteobacteria bacterium]
MLGSRWREEVAELGAATEAAVAEIRRDIALRQVLLALRLSYLDYWLAERKATLSAGIQRHEPEARRTLEQRRDAGLLLESDRRELMTAFALARRNQARASTTAEDALARLNLLTGGSRGRFPAEFPKLPAACHDAAAFPAAIAETHPEIAVLKAIAEAKADRVYFAATAPIESGVNVAQSVVYESTDQTGYGTVLSFDVRMPLDFTGASRAIRDQAAAARIKAGLELELRHRELSAEARRTLGAYEARLAQIAFIREREAAAEEAVRERGLRAAAGLPGDVLEKLEQAHVEQYRVALKAAAAQAGLAIEEARLLAFTPHGCGVRSPTAPRPARVSPRLKDQRPRVDPVGFVPTSPRTLP